MRHYSLWKVEENPPPGVDKPYYCWLTAASDNRKTPISEKKVQQNQQLKLPRYAFLQVTDKKDRVKVATLNTFLFYWF